MAGLPQAGGSTAIAKQGMPAMRHAGAAFAALLIAPFPGAADELCPALSSTTPTPCESLVDPASDLLQNRINSRLNIVGATPDGESVWAESRQAPFRPSAAPRHAPPPILAPTIALARTCCLGPWCRGTIGSSPCLSTAR